MCAFSVSVWLILVVFQNGHTLAVASDEGRKAGKQKGAIQGLVRIGPACPIETSEPCHADPRMFASRKIIVYKKGSAKPFATFKIDANGRYHGTLPPGDYVLDITREGVDQSKDIPQEVHLSSGKVITLDITVDTGVR